MSKLTWKHKKAPVAQAPTSAPAAKAKVPAAQAPEAPAPAVKAPEIKAPEPQKTPSVFSYDRQELPDGGVRYEILCDASIKPSGVFWTKVVPHGATTADSATAKSELYTALKSLAED